MSQIIKLPSGPRVEVAVFGDRRRVKMIPDMGILGVLCPIIWRSIERNPNGTRNILIIVSKSPLQTMPGEVSDHAYDELPETMVEW